MKDIKRMIADLDDKIGQETMEPLDERFAIKISSRTSKGEVIGTLPDPDLMAIRRLHSKYCGK